MYVVRATEFFDYWKTWTKASSKSNISPTDWRIWLPRAFYLNWSDPPTWQKSMLGPTIWLPLAFFPEQERERVLHVYNVLGDYVNGNKSMGDVVTVLGGDYVGRDKAGRDIIQAGGSVTIDQSQISELKDIIAELRKVQDKPELPDEQKQELEAEIQTIESQAKSPKPKIQIIKDALSSAKGIVEQASGVAVAAAPLIARIASWLSGVP
jgi:hypothetical protein